MGQIVYITEIHVPVSINDTNEEVHSSKSFSDLTKNIYTSTQLISVSSASISSL